MSYVAKLAQEEYGGSSQSLFLVTGGRDATGMPAWFYVAVDSLKTTSFRRALMRGAIRLEEYGEIVLSGYGTFPPEAVQARMNGG
jgi:hypothetical protein